MTNNELEVALREAIGVVAMALHIMNDPEDRLNLKQIWVEKAEQMVGEYFNYVRSEAVREEARYKDWIGD